MAMILDAILAQKRKELDAAKKKQPLEALKEQVSRRKAERDFFAALSEPGRLHLIAELKRQSPSRGLLRERFDPVSLAQEMEEAGASALSVLTDQIFFGGRLEYLREAKSFTELPALRKDFVLEPYQVYEAALHGADAVLLIVRILDEPQLKACLEAAHQLELAALVEVHAEAELPAALRAGAKVIGINHRDLDSLAMDLSLSTRLMPKIPKGIVVIAESGIHTPQDVQRMQQLGVHGLLIGESLMTSPSVGGKIRELFQLVW